MKHQGKMLVFMAFMLEQPHHKGLIFNGFELSGVSGVWPDMAWSTGVSPLLQGLPETSSISAAQAPGKEACQRAEMREKAGAFPSTQVVKNDLQPMLKAGLIERTLRGKANNRSLKCRLSWA